jgi:hypothetical protein
MGFRTGLILTPTMTAFSTASKLVTTTSPPRQSTVTLMARLISSISILTETASMMETTRLLE